MNPALMIARRAAGMGADYTVNHLPPGWTKDWTGNVYDESGALVYGPDVQTQTRPLSVDSNPTSNLQTYALSNGQQVQMTPAQYQQVLTLQAAQRQQSQQNLLSGGVTSGGIKIGSTNISWSLIAVAVLAFVLLQHPGVERRK